MERGSCSGEYRVVFQKSFPEVIWQTFDPELVHRKSISSWIEHDNLSKIMPQPCVINIEKILWEITLKLVYSLQGIVFINVIHVAAWTCKIGLFKG